MSAPILTVSQMRDWESASWSAGATPARVIKRMGRLAAQRLLELTRPGDSILVLAGRGHNGDDARAAAPLLVRRKVSLLEVLDPAAAGRELGLWQGNSARCWVLDGLFGIGLNRPLDADWVKFITSVNGLDLPVLSIDSPSGLNVETGEPEGAAIRATLTLAVGAPKLGLLGMKAAPFVGRLETAWGIGLVPCPFETELTWTLAEDFERFPSRRLAESHKGTYGHAGIFAGSVGYHGAGVLAAQAAQRAQPGLISLWTHPAVYLPVASQLRAVMVHPWKTPTPLPGSVTAILAGPGLAAGDLGEEFKDEIREAWLESPRAVLVDASALDWLPTGPTPRHAIRVITPHPGEAARLLGISVEAVQADRPAHLRALSKRYGGCYVILKGRQTLIGRATGEIAVNSSGNPQLAQGGSGDTLGGWLAGLLAQPQFQAAPMRTLRFAVWEHGMAADRLSGARANWTTEDLIEELGRSRENGPAPSRLRQEKAQVSAAHADT